MDQVLDGSFSEKQFSQGKHLLSDQERSLKSFNLPSILVMNKVDLVTNKQKLRDLQNELEDLGNFEKIFHVSASTGFGMDVLKSFLISKGKLRPWQFHPEMISEMSEVEKAEQAMKQAIYEKFFKEIPYQTGIKVTSWVPKINGELRIDIALDVKNKVQTGMLLGEKGRILNEVRERAAQILTERIQRPVKIYVEVKKRRNRIDIQNTQDSFTAIAESKNSN